MSRQWSTFILAWGVVVFILACLAAVQESGLRGATHALGWFDAICIALVAIGAVVLAVIGIIGGLN